MAQAVFPNGVYLTNEERGYGAVGHDRLDEYLQSKPERVQAVFRERIASQAPLQQYGFQTTTHTRDYSYIGQRWQNRVYEMGSPIGEDVEAFFRGFDINSPYYVRVETDPEMIGEIPIESPTVSIPIPREIGVCERILSFLDDLIASIINAVKYFFSCIFAPCLNP